MDPAHLHLMVNHLPILGSMLSLPLIGIAAWRRTEKGPTLAYATQLTLGALGAVVSLTDSELYLSSIVALVVGRIITDTGLWRLRLQILDDLATATAVDPSLSQDTPPSWSGTQ